MEFGKVDYFCRRDCREFERVVLIRKRLYILNW